MVESEPFSAPTPLFSVIIAVCNDWVPLDRCLRSLAEQTHAPSKEVIVVDDGSRETAPEFIQRWASSYLLRIVRQPHAGIATARNKGIQVSKGSVLVFVDADCKLQTDCLSTLASTIKDSAQHNCFQLHLTGDCSGLVGRAEELRLQTLQEHMLQPNGCIRYLNTAGFAIRRTRIDDIEGEVFHPAALRNEDTLLLANLMQAGELPRFVPNAIVQHAIPLSLMECFLKDIRSAFPEAKADDLIASKGVRIRASHRERLSMLASMWKKSKRQSIGRLAWFVVIARQGIGRFLSVAYSCFRVRPSSHLPASSS
jgi:glycosyltransferase involved in cell wall biosynthesis